MTIAEYKLKKDFRAPKINLKQGEMQAYRSYSAGQTATGYVDGSTGAQLLIIENTYALPLNVLQHVRDIEIDGKPVKEVKTEPASTVKKDGTEKVVVPKEYREKMESIKNTNVVENIVKKSRNSVNGTLIGGIAGLLIAAFSGKSKLMGIVLGATAGGLIGYNLPSQDKKKKEVTKQTDKKTENGK